jgi:crotonobetainyl-CoA:carnitine CoA-transferase CaiB-like acyl-CoA transferase
MQPADTPEPPRLPPASRRPPGTETPLVGIRVVDFTHFIAGPFATLILADFGAEVIKIENAEEGDAFRTYPPLLGGEGAPYLWTNRNKASVALDLKTVDGRATALALMEMADIVVENFSTGVMTRLGLDYDTVAARNPGVVYCSISAYGRDGPFADRLGFDPIAQAESGFISMNGFPEQQGVRAGPSIMDMATAMMSANAMLAALTARQRTGRGQYVEAALFETAINMLGNFSMAYLATGVNPSRFGNSQPTACPVGAFETASGPIYLACANDRTFFRFAREVVGRADIADDPDFATSHKRRENRDRLLALVADALLSGPRETWLERTQAAGVPAGAIRTVAEALQSPEVQARNLVSAIPHPVLGTVPNVALPVRLHGTPLADPVAAPGLGADTERVLSTLLGYDRQRLEALAQAGAFGKAGQHLASTP